MNIEPTTLEETAFPEIPAKEPLVLFAHRKAIRLATQYADPLLQRSIWEKMYWTAMAGHGFFPYRVW